MRDYKVVVLGAGGVGKSALTVQFVQNVYIDSYDPTIEDSYRKVVDVDHRQCTLEILDTAGVEQFTAMRELYIKSGDGFVLVYSVNSKNSLRELLELREQVIAIKDNLHVPMVLVANKSDDPHREVSPGMGIAVADQWGRVPFYETSAKLRLNVDEVFVDLIRQIVRRDSAVGSALNYRASSRQSAASSLSTANTLTHVRSSGQLGSSNKKQLRSMKSSRRLAHAASTFSLRRSSKKSTPWDNQDLGPERDDKKCTIM